VPVILTTWKEEIGVKSSLDPPSQPMAGYGGAHLSLQLRGKYR
jgi:hypothetical protein